MADAVADASTFLPIESTSNPTPKLSSDSPTFEAASVLVGSSYPGRLAYVPAFNATEVFTEEMATLPLATQQSLGYSLADMLLGCQFDEMPCDGER